LITVEVKLEEGVDSLSLNLEVVSLCLYVNFERAGASSQLSSQGCDYSIVLSLIVWGFGLGVVPLTDVCGKGCLQFVREESVESFGEAVLDKSSSS
jgi:hypothetical protein